MRVWVLWMEHNTWVIIAILVFKFRCVYPGMNMIKFAVATYLWDNFPLSQVRS